MRQLFRRPAAPTALVAFFVALAPAFAGCAPAPGDTLASVAAISDALDLTLADGRILRLAGIDPPRPTATAPDLPARARRALAAWIAAGPPMFRLLSPAPDRWGRIPALLFRAAPTASSAAPSAAEALLRAGLARERPDASVHGCVSAFLAAESAARAQTLGLWADPRYAVLAADDAGGLAAQAGDMVLVEGILHVHEGRGALYLALGRDRWGFAAAVAQRDAQRFARAGLDLTDYEGTPVRLRGDLDARFGFRMRLTDPDALESLEPGSLAEEGDGGGRSDPVIVGAKHWTVPPRPR